MKPPELLCVGEFDEQAKALLDQLRPHCDVSQPESLLDGLKALSSTEPDGVLLNGHNPRLTANAVLEAGGILDQIPNGLALIDARFRIVWCNSRLQKMCREGVNPVGEDFFDAMHAVEILGPDFGPFQTVLATGDPARTTVRVDEKTHLDIHTEAIVQEGKEFPEALIVVVRDVSAEVQQRQKLDAIYSAGVELGELSPRDIEDLGVEDRAELLKSQILNATQHILGFDTVEIRLLDAESGRLDPLLAEGMEPMAESRELFAEPQNNGVTGFVAATGKSYLCEDTHSDPLFIVGAADTRSSLTVPLILHDEVLGTFNVESPGASAFDQNDLQFLELFGREVALALNTLELLVAEKITTANRNTERIMKEIAKPVDEVLADAAWVLERYIGHDPDVCERFQRILKHTRDVRKLIQTVGEEIAPTESYGHKADRPYRVLREKRILVIDSDESIRTAAHELLAKFGCFVETARDAKEGFLMARSFHYDVALTDIKLPDSDGYECFVGLRKIHEHMPIILMTAYGYDPSHSIVKARPLGLKSVLYKPFRLDQMLSALQEAVSPPAAT